MGQNRSAELDFVTLFYWTLVEKTEKRVTTAESENNDDEGKGALHTTLEKFENRGLSLWKRIECFPTTQGHARQSQVILDLGLKKKNKRGQRDHISIMRPSRPHEKRKARRLF